MSAGLIFKIITALFVAAALSQLPMMRVFNDNVVAGFIGDGVILQVVSVALYFMLGWYLVSTAARFGRFAFGGGIGRYSTTKIYRRIQYITFILMMSVLVAMLLPFIITATPARVYSDRYERAVARELAGRREIAEDQRRAAYNQAVARRQSEITAKQTELTEKYKRDDLDVRLKIIWLRKAWEAGAEEIYKAQTAKLEDHYRWIIPQIVKAYTEARPYDHRQEFEEQLREFSKEIFKTINSVDYLKNREKYEEKEMSQTAINNIVKDRENLGENLLPDRLYDSCPSVVTYVEGSAIILSPYAETCFIKSFLEFFDIFNEESSRQLSTKFPLVRTYGALTAVLEQATSGDEYMFVSMEKEFLQATRTYQETMASFSHDLTHPNQDDYILDPKTIPQPTLASFPLRIDQSPTSVTEEFLISVEAVTVKYWGLIVLAALTIWIVIQLKAQQQLSRLVTPILEFFDQGRMGRGGAARFATMFEEWRNAHKQGKLFIGRSTFNPWQYLGLGGEAHMLTVAGSRGGKGSSVIIPNLLEWSGSAVVIDPKGTNAHVTAQARRDMGHDVHIIDPFNIVTKDSARFDPLADLDADNRLLSEWLGSITDALVHIKTDAKDPHWDEKSKTVIGGMIAHILSTPTNEKWLPDIRNLIDLLPKEQDELWVDMAVNDRAFGIPSSAAKSVLRSGGNTEVQNILSNVDKHTAWLASPAMRDILTNPTFKLSDLRTKPTTVYLVIPPLQIERHKRLIRLFVNLVIETVERGGKSPTPILMIIDEFLALGRLDEFPQAFATMASYNLTLWPFVQDIGQTKKLYGESFNAFEANSRALQVFAIDDKASLEFISEKMGKQPLVNVGDITRSNEAVELRSPNDISKDVAPHTYRQYMIERGKQPMLLERVPYYKNRKYKGRYSPDPDFK